MKNVLNVNSVFENMRQTHFADQTDLGTRKSLPPCSVWGGGEEGDMDFRLLENTKNRQNLSIPFVKGKRLTNSAINKIPIV